MQVFEYQALNAQGKVQKGKLEADSAKEARSLLRQQGLMPTAVKPLVEKGTKSHQAWLKRSLPLAELMAFSQQLAVLLQAGLPLVQALDVLIQQGENRRQVNFLSGLKEDIMAGESLAKSLDKSRYLVPKMMIATLAAGEESGFLSAVLQRLSETLEQSHKLKSQVQTALIYPSLMLLVALGIVSFLLVSVLPKVLQVFTDMKQALPPLTENLLALSALLQTQGIWWVLGFLLGVLGFKILLQNAKLQSQWEKFLLSLPLVGPLVRTIVLARFSRTLGLLLNSGVPMEQALGIGTQVVAWRVYETRVAALKESVRQGKSLSKAMGQGRDFPPLLRHLVASGEESGTLDKMLEKAASQMELKVEQQLKVLLSLLEPVMILIMGGLVLMVVMAIMLPIFEMNNLMG